MWIYDSGSQIRNVKEARGRTIILEVEGDTLLTGVRAGGTNNVEKPFSRAREVLDTAQWSS
jgi:hypothetical protein